MELAMTIIDNALVLIDDLGQCLDSMESFTSRSVISEKNKKKIDDHQAVLLSKICEIEKRFLRCKEKKISLCAFETIDESTHSNTKEDDTSKSDDIAPHEITIKDFCRDEPFDIEDLKNKLKLKKSQKDSDPKLTGEIIKRKVVVGPISMDYAKHLQNQQLKYVAPVKK